VGRVIPKKKVVLFIVEGANDQIALSVPLENLLTNENVKFEVIEGDVTADYIGKTVVAKIGDCVNNHCKVNGYEKSDILEVVLLVDMDGAFIDPDLIIQDDTFLKPYYCPDKIYHPKPDNLIKTHAKKKHNLNHLIKLPHVIKTIPFSIYFFSCNMDHVICGDANLTQIMKSKAADSFLKKYHSDSAGFLEFFHSEDISVGKTYEESWIHIKQDENSLKRCSNLHIFLSQEAIRIKRDIKSSMLSIADSGND